MAEDPKCFSPPPRRNQCRLRETFYESVKFDGLNKPEYDKAFVKALIGVVRGSTFLQQELEDNVYE